MITGDAIGHRARDAELHEAWEEHTGFGFACVFDANLLEKEEKRSLGGHWQASVGCGQDFGGCIMWSRAGRQRAGMKGLGRPARWDG